MPTEYQSGSGEWGNEAERFLSSDMDLSPLLRGIEDEQRAVMYWNEANKLDVSQKTKKKIRTKMQSIRDR